MRAALSRKSGEPLVVEDVTIDDPRDDRVLVRMDASAVCSTDSMLLAPGGFEQPRPVIPGHSGTGIVEAVGPNVRSTAVGDRIVVTGTMECGQCYFCRHGAPSQCELLWRDTFAAPKIGTTGDGLEIRAVGGIGTMSTHITYPERAFSVVQSDLPVEQLALLGCGGISGVGAVLEVGGVTAGDTVAVIGCGHLGLWMIQAARAAGAALIVAIEPIAARRAAAAALGATVTVDPGADDPLTVIRDLTGGRGVDVALEATGAPNGVSDAFALARNSGVVVATSMVPPLDSTKVVLPNLDVSMFGKVVRGSQSGGGFIHRDIQMIADLIAAGRIDAAAMVSRVFSLDQTDEAFAAAVAREVITGVVLNQEQGALSGANT
ncbi:zinc-binding dehydrogenase [Herbiconiux ginsengi]|uniref:Alcohol dehydrogenase/S-(Hydroxymethyl)glutathione dehydrogenase / alcohol dehydrogenase n=1 Tax=Herbiconiux ginsengi TaxID=381665 RepID=A0A1H3LNQ1_9MICO|nr:zinc-binding dehydrogenase [Herbiconiux ginsengi]SDY65759.1 alcohol dehydrogenase/S-(hydroxymethyl)glutathione dehydrogenase / alcohol dehydrogenase [Herbiconiux ginsengi]